MRIGIDLGGTKIAGIVLDPHGQTVATRRVPTPTQLGYAGVLQAITAVVQSLEAEAGTTCSVGIGAPGQVSRRTQRVKNSNATCLNDQPLLDDLQDRLQRQVRLTNDANCFTLSEASDGAAARHRVVFGVILGTGVGGGISIDQEIYGGCNGIAGEWGHICLQPDGPACYCGRRGCIETYLSGPGLFADYRKAGGTQAADAAQIATLSAAGQDEQASAAMRRYCQRFGQAMAIIVNVLDPEAIVLGGGLSNIRALYDAGVAAMGAYVFNDQMSTPIYRHQHGDASGVRGAAMLWPDGRPARHNDARDDAHVPPLRMPLAAASGGRQRMHP